MDRRSSATACEDAMAEVQWYYARNNEQFGPVSANELRQLVDAGRLSPDDLLWREGMEAWSTAINLRGLFTAEPGKPPSSSTIVAGSQPILVRPDGTSGPPAVPDSLRRTLRAIQILLWTTCVLVVLVGL